jgi:uncharacterized protein (DUF1778 family)
MEQSDGKTKINLSLTPANKVGRPAREGSAPVTWSIRGVEPDTRRVIEKAAERTGKTLGQYINEDFRSFAQGQLTQTQLPAAPVDIQNQIDQLTQMIETLTNRMPEPGRKSFWQRLFG